MVGGVTGRNFFDVTWGAHAGCCAKPLGKAFSEWTANVVIFVETKNTSGDSVPQCSFKAYLTLLMIFKGPGWSKDFFQLIYVGSIM